MSELVPVERIESKIYLIRGKKVMLDRDLAALYIVQTRDLNKAVTRNLDRFPEDFMFQLNRDEYENLKFQFGTSSWGGIRKLPRVFTEQGIAMLSSVLRSKRAVQMNIMIMRAFVRLRHVLLDHKELMVLFNKLETKVDQHDTVINEIVEAIKELMTPVQTDAIGFVVGKRGLT